ncbi:hypothetical protein SLS60_011130 [Paraconiothyrium brasiliense]|uniref:F-box domain-containing protein n=1 Tax=Paraconiothyrium brasiliense TaxID=300254 RepID=A0ABR3QKN3_9PLEO
MGSFDCYCALCSGPLGKGWVRFGRKNEEALTKRRRRVELKKRRLEGEDVNESDDGGDEDDKMVEDVVQDANADNDEDGGKMGLDAVHGDNEGDDKMEEDVIFEDNEGDGKNLATDERVAESPGEKDVPDTSHDHDLALYLQAMVDNDDDVNGENGNEEAGSDGSETGDAESNEHGSEAESSDNDDSDESSSQTGSVDSYDEKVSYDPEKLKRKDVAWLERGHVLGFNPEAPGVTKAFISGRGSYEDYGSFNVVRPGHDPNDPQLGSYTCYTSYEPDVLPTYPFHEGCLQVLAKSLGLGKEDEIDRDVLYTVFSQNNDDYARVLALNYGQLDGPEQCWDSVQGEEYVVSDPGYKKDLSKAVQNLIPSKLFMSRAGSLDLAHKVQNDPLRVLPYDVLYEIFTHLSFKDSRSLMQSSWHVFASTRNGPFWKQMLRLHVLPWFWEVSAIAGDSSTTEHLGEKNSFLWIEAATRPRFGIEGPLMGIANRRRIWNVCQQLAPQYAEKVQPVGQAEPDDAEAQAILDRSQCFHMPIVAYPAPKEIRTVSTQFIRSWSEVSYRSSVLDTYWGPTGALVGVSITFSGTSPRIFGRAEGTLGNPLHIPSNEWIREIIVSIDDVNMFSRRQDRSQVRTAMDNKPYGVACIRSLTVTLTNNATKCVRTPGGQAKNKRPFIVLSGLHLIGLTGQIAEGLSTDKMRSTGDIASDMTPWQVCIWTRDASPKSLLKRISCFQPVDGTASNAKETWSTRHVAGFEVGYTSGHQHLLAGSGGPEPVQSLNWQEMTDPRKDLVSWIQNTELKSFDEDSMEHFYMDGPRGEIITEVHASDDMKAIKLFTNKGRDCYFGESGRQQWTEYQVEPGHRIVGLVCAFGRLAGWSWGAKMYSHWVLSGLGVLTVAED